MNGRKNYNDIKEVGINDYIRNKVDKSLTKKIQPTIILKDSLYLVFKRSLDEKTKEDELISSALASILYLDSYKVLLNKIKSLKVEEDDITFFSTLSSMESLDDVKEYYRKNDSSIMESINYIKEFFNYSSITKLKIMKSLTEDENEKLNSITSIHQDDMDKYNKTIDKDFIYNYYDKQTRYFNSKNIKNSSDAVIMMISNFFKSIYHDSNEEVTSTLIGIYNDVFKNIEKIYGNNKEIMNVIDFYAKDFQKDNESFVKESINDLDIMKSLLTKYFAMRKQNIIEPKTYKKD